MTSLPNRPPPIAVPRTTSGPATIPTPASPLQPHAAGTSPLLRTSSSPTPRRPSSSSPLAKPALNLHPHDQPVPFPPSGHASAPKGSPIIVHDHDDDLPSSVLSTPSLGIANEFPSATDPRRPLRPRNIVVLLDGTGKQFSRNNSNVIKTLSVLEADETQLLYYSSGVGTVLPDHASTWGRVRTAVAEAADKALAWNFEDFVCGAYKYLMDFYRAGDKLFIFGFSRGAYVARALAGMIQKVGLLAPGNHNQVKLAYEVYIRPESVANRERMTNAEEMSVMYRQIFGISRTVRIEFVGVWDTVSSLGGLTLPRLPNAGSVKSVKFFRQALALDERRARFAPEYRHLHPSEPSCSHDTAQIALATAHTAQRLINDPDTSHADRMSARQILHELLNKEYPEIARAKVVLEDIEGSERGETRYWRKNVECWFMGCHSDVGGGNDLNGRESLSNIPFRWLLREAVRCGIKLEAAGICLQPAIYTSPSVHRANLIPSELIRILQEELHGELIEFDTEARIRSIVDKHLPHSRLVEIVEMAARFDGEMKKGDDPRGLPMGVDGVRRKTESLTGVWWVLEGLLLQTREYEGREGKEGKDRWRVNLGRGRQMVSDQYIHKSVLKRLRYDTPLDGWAREGMGKPYKRPKADLPPEWGLDWDGMRTNEDPRVWEE